MSGLFQLKRILSNSCGWKVKLNSYTGYVVPIAVYASQKWLPSRSNIQKFEKVQHHATKRILNSNQLPESLSDQKTVVADSLYTNAQSFAYNIL